MNPHEALGTELDVVAEAARILAPHGQVSIVYITAEFAPFSSQTKPDIIFLPLSGPTAGAAVFTELRMFKSKPMRPDFVRLLPEHRSFVIESSELPLRFIFATDEEIEPSLKIYLEENGVEFLGRIASGEQLARAVLALVQAA